MHSLALLPQQLHSRPSMCSLGLALQLDSAVRQGGVADSLTDCAPARGPHANLLHTHMHLHHLPHVHVQALQAGGDQGKRAASDD